MTYIQLETTLSELNITMSDFCKLTGISRQVITNAKSRGGHFSASTMEKMRFFLNNMEKSISPSAYELAKDFDLLEPEHQKTMLDMMAFLKSKKQD